MQYTTDVRIIRLMCTGRVDPTMVAEAFENGADGLMVVGCHFGDCHYITGNYQGKVKLGLAARMLEFVGLNPKRVSFSQCSGAEGDRFVALVGAFDKLIQEIGPLGTGDRLALPELNEKIGIAKTALASEKLRWVAGKFTEFCTQGNKYGERFTEHEMWRTLDTIIMDEILTHEILRELRKAPAAVKDLAERIGAAPQNVLRYVLALQRRGFVTLGSIEGSSPVYRIQTESALAAAHAA
jgi:F420-non-reducing hydrogenase iron-sulfur subunit